MVYGYADSAGDTYYNQELSYKRALSVRDYLWRISSRGLDIRAEGLGEAENTSFRNPFDRRVDIFITVADMSLTEQLRNSAVAVWVGFIGSLVTIFLASASLIEKTGIFLIRRIVMNNTGG